MYRNEEKKITAHSYNRRFSVFIYFVLFCLLRNHAIDMVHGIAMHSFLYTKYALQQMKRNNLNTYY